MHRIRLLLVLVAVLLCSSIASAEVIYVVGTGNTLISLNSATPGTVVAARAITGLGTGEQIVGIDFRPASGALVALTNGSRIYNINVSTAAATAVGSAAFSPALNGFEFGMDFNPTVDRIRVVSDTGQNLRLNPDTGAVAATDSSLAYASTDVASGIFPSIVAVAYTNSTATATNTTLYGIDSFRDTLVRQGSIGASPVSPNSGQLFTIGPLGVNTDKLVGFDISSATGTAYASLQVGSTTDLYTIDLSTGAATRVGTIGGSTIVRGLAVAQAAVLLTLPVVGSAAGQNGTSFKSEVTFTNPTAFSVPVHVDFYASGLTANTAPIGSFDVTLAPGEQKLYSDIVQQFGISGATGALRISATRPITVSARIYNDQRTLGKGTFGQLERGFEETDRRTSGSLTALSNIPAANPDGARTNVGFFNPGTTDVTVTLNAKNASGTTIATVTRVIPALSQQQIALSQLFPTLPEAANVYVTFTTTGGSLFVYASVIDNTSGDANFVPATR